jgi:hypothetical protein
MVGLFRLMPLLVLNRNGKILHHFWMRMTTGNWAYRPGQQLRLSFGQSLPVAADSGLAGRYYLSLVRANCDWHDYCSNRQRQDK